MLGNWNLLWYGVIAAAILAGPRLASAPVAPFTMIMAAGALFLAVVFTFTNAREWVETQTTINRAVLHLAPLSAVWMLVAFRAWATRNDVNCHCRRPRCLTPPDAREARDSTRAGRTKSRRMRYTAPSMRLALPRPRRGCSSFDQLTASPIVPS